jgi:uncharacterized integral membrane protein (TIGR00698 family)
MTATSPAGQKKLFEHITTVLPGILLCSFLGLLSWFIAGILKDTALSFLNYVVIAVISGILIKNMLTLPVIMNPGIAFSAKIFLYAGVILLGARLNVLDIFSLGLPALLMVAVSITASIYFCGKVMEKVNGNRRWGHLIGAGIGVCGVSAIMSLAPCIKAREREVVSSIGVVLVNDIALLLLLPAVAVYMGWDDYLVGYLSGVVPSNTAQCIAIGYTFSEQAGVVTTIVKSVRNTLIPVVVLVMTYLYTRQGLPVGVKLKPFMLWEKFPKFVIGFLLASMLNTFGLLSVNAIKIAGNLSTSFFVVCFVALGAGINIRELGRGDFSAFITGVLMVLIIGVYAFLYSTVFLNL